MDKSCYCPVCEANAARIEALEAENFRLAAGVCINPGQHALIGDEHGNPVCTAYEALPKEQARCAELEAEVARLREAANVERQIGRIQLANEWAEWLEKPCIAVEREERQPVFDEAAQLYHASARRRLSREIAKLPLELQFDEAVMSAALKDTSHEPNVRGEYICPKCGIRHGNNQAPGEF